MSIHNSRSVRQSYPLYVVGSECSVSARYQPETPIEAEKIHLGFSGELLDGGSLAIKLDPETAERLYGAIGAELKVWKGHVEFRLQMEARRQEEEAAQCKTVGEVRP